MSRSTLSAAAARRRTAPIFAALGDETRLALVSSLASGVPVIGSRAGGLPEVVRDGETGALCTPGDVDGMAAAASRLLRDPARWRTASELAKADARARFGMEAVVGQYEALYRRMREE